MRDVVLLADGLTQDAELRGRDRAAAREPAARRAGPDGAGAARLELPGRRAGSPIPAGDTGVGRRARRRSSRTTTCWCSGRASWSLQRSVVLSGQVKSPGRYSLRSKTERLADLIERAGGLTPEAYAGRDPVLPLVRRQPADRHATAFRLLHRDTTPARLAAARLPRAGRHRPAPGAEGPQVPGQHHPRRPATRSTSRSSIRS